MIAAAGERSGGMRRMVLVVPRAEAALYEYLKRSMAAVPEIEVVLDRRGPSADRAADAPGVERRRHEAGAVRRILMCALVQGGQPAAPAPAVEAPPAPPADTPPEDDPGTPPASTSTPARTLLWPQLRLGDVS
jgi:hypothetical protein